MAVDNNWISRSGVVSVRRKSRAVWNMGVLDGLDILVLLHYPVEHLAVDLHLALLDQPAHDAVLQQRESFFVLLALQLADDGIALGRELAHVGRYFGHHLRHDHLVADIDRSKNGTYGPGERVGNVTGGTDALRGALPAEVVRGLYLAAHGFRRCLEIPAVLGQQSGGLPGLLLRKLAGPFQRPPFADLGLYI